MVWVRTKGQRTVLERERIGVLRGRVRVGTVRASGGSKVERKADDVRI